MKLTKEQKKQIIKKVWSEKIHPLDFESEMDSYANEAAFWAAAFSEWKIKQYNKYFEVIYHKQIWATYLYNEI